MCFLCLCLPTAWAAADTAAAEQGSAPVIRKTDVRYAMDFDYVSAALPDSVAWLYQPGTVINQPVMYSEDLEYYLRRQFNGRFSANGAIFVAGNVPAWQDDPVITLYGRNCQDNYMFGSFSLYQDAEYYQANPTLYLLTSEGNYQLDIFAGIGTKQSDTETWTVSGSSTAALFADELPRILSRSFLEPDGSMLPTVEDAWAVLATQALDNNGSRYVLYARKRPLDDQNAPAVYLNQREMDSRETLNGLVNIDGVGQWMLYAQNDPLWQRLIFEARTSGWHRPFGDGGCGPTAIAMAIANLVDKEELSKLRSYALSPLGYRFCSCSVNEYWCSGEHLAYQLTTPEEYLRYYPLAVASFATGNNTYGLLGRTNRFGSSMNYLEALCQVYDLSMSKTTDLKETLSFLQQEGTIAIACSTGYNSPFTNSSHFVVLARVADGYLYILDPLRREDYRVWDPKGYLEVLTPGLVRVKVEKATKCRLSPMYLMQRADEAQETAEF